MYHAYEFVDIVQTTIHKNFKELRQKNEQYREHCNILNINVIQDMRN